MVVYALLGVVIVSVGLVAWGVRASGIVPMPSSRSTRQTVERVLLSAPGLDRVTDLGSGWGGLARRLARSGRFESIVAVELSPLPHMVGALLSWFADLPVTHRRADALSLELAPGGYVTYLSRGFMLALRERFEEQLPHGGLLVSVAFSMPGWTPARVEHAHDLFHTPIYVYEF